ncbi:30S ribosomal protein S8 [Candidatus Woesearchaeota archaeon]|nr:30S ribosomal protein S8 [Candidatus Woesearchaeota archaeon]
MTMNDPLASALSKINNADKVGKKQVTIYPVSKVIKGVLDIMNREGYVGTYEEVEDSKGNHLVLNLLGNTNECGAIKPRYSVQLEDFLKFEKRFLRAKDFGVLLVSTSKGLMTHVEAKEKKLGGVLFSYCY